MSHRLRILHITASLYTGGAERLLLGLAEQCNRAEFEVHICAIGHFGKGTMSADFEQLDLPLHRIPVQRFYDPRSVIALIRYIKRHNIDLLHTHLLYGDILGRLVGALLRLPVVSTLQNDPRDNHHARIDKRWLNRLTASLAATHLVTVSDQIRQGFLEEWQLDAAQVSTIYNAVNLAPFLAIPEPPATAQPATATAARPLTITTIGRLKPQKGQHLLLDAVKPLFADHPDVRLLIVGEGPLAAQLQMQAANLGIADRVAFTGLQSDIPQILAQTDIFVLPSLWEGLPLAAIEAMAAARPVILTNVGGNRELIPHEREGILIPPNDIQALSDALLALLHDPEQRRALGQQARLRAQQAFDMRVITKQYEALYRRICDQGQKRRQLVSSPATSGSAHE
ncbi:MAG: glycosyltransferase [Caldilineaceae bacterium]